jgi:putative CocE/NonD family hydrolase
MEAGSEGRVNETDRGLRYLALRLISIVPFACVPMLSCLAQAPAARSVGYEVKIEFDQRVSMRDGIELSADIYRPNASGPFPVILTRTPYNKSTERGNHLGVGRYFAAHGYVYVAMDVRGRGDSDGVFVPYRNEGADGFDSIEWCAKQKWSSGKVGTIGSSYLGYDQWIAALQQPPHLATMIVLVTPPDPFVESPTGLQSPTYLSWYHLLLGHTLHNAAAVDWNALYLHLPLSTMDEAGGFSAPYWQDILNHPGVNSWWEPLIYQNKFNRVNLPILHVSGWYDDEQAGAVMNYTGMTERGATPEARKNQKLLMGPWPHAVNSTRRLGAVDFGPSAQIDLDGYELRWFERWLKGVENGLVAEAPVRIFVMGRNEWQDRPGWPIPGTHFVNFFLSSNGRANSLFGDGRVGPQSASPSPADHFRYDPLDPVPFIMESTYAQLGGPDDYRPVERRDDVLVYTSEAIDVPEVICGPIKAHLSAASSATDTDFMMKLIDVWPNGFAQRLTDGMVRARYREGGDRPSLIEPGQIYGFDVDLWNTCQEFGRGHRVRVEVSSSAFPKYDRNQNTGEALGKTSNTKIATQTIYHDLEYPSYVILPMVPGDN